MHPIELLRFVARSRGAAPEALARDAAAGLASFAVDPRDLVIATRRLLEHHRDVAQMWWLCSRVLAAPDPAREASRVARLLDGAWRDELVIPDDGPSIVAVAAGPDRVLVTAGDARRLGGEAAVVIVPIGCAVPSAYVDAIAEAAAGHGTRLVDLDGDRIAGVRDHRGRDLRTVRPDCPLVPELLTPR